MIELSQYFIYSKGSVIHGKELDQMESLVYTVRQL